MQREEFTSRMSDMGVWGRTPSRPKKGVLRSALQGVMRPGSAPAFGDFYNFLFRLKFLLKIIILISSIVQNC